MTGSTAAWTKAGRLASDANYIDAAPASPTGELSTIFDRESGTGGFDGSTPQKPNKDDGFRQRAHDDAALVRTDRTDPPPPLLQVRILRLSPFPITYLLPFTTDRAREERR